MVRKLAIHAPLSEQDRGAVQDLPHCVLFFDPGSYIVRDGNVSDQCVVLLSGFAFRHKVTSEGHRQIVSLLIPGEIVNLQQLYLNVADHGVQTLTRCKVATISKAAVRTLASDRAAIGDALIASTMVDASIYREWMMNIGRRDARTRIAHLLCEFAARLDVQGIAPGQPYALPMTQEQLGDALGLTAVHVNRTLRGLINDGLVAQNRRGISFPAWKVLKVEADFNSRYLHLREHVTAPGYTH
jgi:CRP-like cAMP-binding protein